MGKTINSKKLDYCPYIDYQREMFYFTSERIKEGTKISSLEDFIQTANNPQNGMGDFYQISLDKLLLD